MRFLCLIRILSLQAMSGERSSAELAQDIVHEAQELVRLEVRLARQELKELAVRNAIAIGLLAFAGVLVLLGLLVALPVLLVVWSSNPKVAAAIWLGACFALVLILAVAGRLALRLQPPRRTLSSLEETKTWVLRQIRSSSK